MAGSRATCSVSGEALQVSLCHSLAQLGRIRTSPEQHAVRVVWACHKHHAETATRPYASLLQVLRAMAASKSRAVRQQFMQLHVLDMLVRELSLEYEAQQVRLPPAPCLASNTSSSAGALRRASFLPLRRR